MKKPTKKEQAERRALLARIHRRIEAIRDAMEAGLAPDAFDALERERADLRRALAALGDSERPWRPKWNAPRSYKAARRASIETARRLSGRDRSPTFVQGGAPGSGRKG